MSQKIREIAEIVSDTLNLIDKNKHFFAMSQIRHSNAPDDIKSVYVTNSVNDTEMSEHDIWIVNYHSPVGKIAELGIGDIGYYSTLQYGNTGPELDKECCVLQKNKFKWILPKDVSADMFFESGHPIALNSFRKYHSTSPLQKMSIETKEPIVSTGTVNDLNLDFDTILSMGTISQESRLFSQVQRKTIKKLGLTGEDVLDSIQGHAMREQPYINRVLMGPAGTGKTTTMIKKLGMNMDSRYTQLRDKDKLDEWYMFTPNHLLKRYLKEAFAREGIGAPDEKVMVWADFARQIGKDLQVLKSLNSEGFELDEQLNSLRNCSADDLIAFYEEFNEWYVEYFNLKKVNFYKKGLNFHDSELDSCLKEFEYVFVNNMSINVMCKNMDELLERYTKQDPNELQTEETTPLMKRLEKVKQSKERKIFALTQNIINKFNPTTDKDELLMEIQRTSDKLVGHSMSGYFDKNQVFRNLIVPAIKRFASGSKMNKQDVLVLQRLGLGAQSGELDELKNIAILDSQYKYCDKFMTFCTRLRAEYISDIRVAYKEFKETNQRFFTNTDSQKISQNELDILLLFLVKTYKELHYSTNKFPGDYCKIHIYIDEITDFSPIQIKVIYSLFYSDKRPAFFATGDFNQRFTISGIQNLTQLNWAVPSTQIQNLKRPYRQTQILANLSQRLKGEEALVMSKEYDFVGKPPIVGYEKTTTLQIAEWLRDRLLEIAKKYPELPSIAVIVENEENIEPLAQKMNELFKEYNIEVEPCYKGRVLGEKNNIRIFSVDYIKGLEFESVFFVNIDKLATIKGEAFKNFLYVGASRAAMFFGLTTTQSELPPALIDLKSEFKTDWK